MSLNVVSSGENGQCVELNKDTNIKWFCEKHMLKAPFYVPLNANGSDLFNYVFRLDQSIGLSSIYTELSHCLTDRINIACGFGFQPCSTLEPPTPSGLCLKACRALSNCDHDGGGKGDWGEICKSNIVVDNTKKDILCGSTGRTKNTITKVFVIGMLVIQGISQFI